LRIQAYLYRPEGEGPFFPPSSTTTARGPDGSVQSVPFEHIRPVILTSAGYVALVSERRGYGRSDGAAWPEDVGKNRGRTVARLDEETDDVLAAVDLPADIKRSWMPAAWA
jgi:predicted acyl esterase